MPVSIKSKIGPGDLGDVTAAQRLPDGSKEILFLGTIIGKIDGMTYRANPNGDAPSVGFTGVFEGESSDPAIGTIQSSTLFLPGSLSAMIEKTLLGDKPPAVTVAPKRGAKVDVPVEQLPIAIEVCVKKSGNALGYEYDIRFHSEQKKLNVLDDLRKLIPAGLTNRVAATSPKALAAPEPAKGKAKGKR